MPARSFCDRAASLPVASNGYFPAIEMSPLPDAAALDRGQHAQMTVQAKRIVVGFDGSEGASRALAAALQLRGYGSPITVVSVGAGGDQDGAAPLDAARHRLLEELVTADYVSRRGDPADELVCAARELDADVIVVGRRRPFENARAELGSVSAEVVRHAPCDVLVVR